VRHMLKGNRQSYGLLSPLPPLPKANTLLTSSAKAQDSSICDLSMGVGQKWDISSLVQTKLQRQVVADA
jgi:hypothetical protein